MSTPVYCKNCKVYLCIKESARDWNCWEQFHTCNNLDDKDYIPSESGSDEDDSKDEQESDDDYKFLNIENLIPIK
jgi:hypothetical protein